MSLPNTYDSIVAERDYLAELVTVYQKRITHLSELINTYCEHSSCTETGGWGDEPTAYMCDVCHEYMEIIPYGSYISGYAEAK